MALQEQEGRAETKKVGSDPQSCVSLVTTWPHPLTGWDTRRTSSTVYTVEVPCTDGVGLQPSRTITPASRPSTTSMASPTHSGKGGNGDAYLAERLGPIGGIMLVLLIVGIWMGWKDKRKRDAVLERGRRLLAADANKPPGNNPQDNNPPANNPLANPPPDNGPPGSGPSSSGPPSNNPDQTSDVPL
ncbi:MAG: hypothetical protein LQ350_003195 [Teloschistes chrysophthalmus]|nr:MAG: hypothetical protein LQ350_003195 [Niorma chrysophthalma]